MAPRKKKEDNLKPAAHTLTVEEASRGGKASAEKRRQNRTMQESLQYLLNLSTKSADVVSPEDVQLLSQMTNKSITVSDAILIAQLKKAMKGDLRAAEFLRDTAGQKPIERKELKQEIRNPYQDLSTDELRRLLDEDDT